MRHFGRKVDKIARANFRYIFETLAPPDLATPLVHIDRDFVRAVVMGASSSIRLKCHCPHPDLRTASACKLECCGPAPARSARDMQAGCTHHFHSVSSPISGTHDQLPQILLCPLKRIRVFYYDQSIMLVHYKG